MSDRPHIIVSGGSRGLGQAIVQALLQAEYAVSTFSRRPTEFTCSLRDHPAFQFCEADVIDHDKVERFLTAAQQRLGRVWGLINCAGVAVDGVLATMPPEAIDRAIAVNLGGALHLTRLAIRSMILNPDGGAVVNISSIIGLRGYAGLAAYAASKGGMDAMTRALARELGPRGIRVNSVAPGYLETEMSHGLSDSQKEQIVRRTPLGRLGQVADVVGPVLFLLSPQARFITGQTLVVDGGITA